MRLLIYINMLLCVIQQIVWGRLSSCWGDCRKNVGINYEDIFFWGGRIGFDFKDSWERRKKKQEEQEKDEEEAQEGKNEKEHASGHRVLAAALSSSHLEAMKSEKSVPLCLFLSIRIDCQICFQTRILVYAPVGILTEFLFLYENCRKPSWNLNLVLLA